MSRDQELERKFDEPALLIAALEERFGLGTNPRRREELFRRIAESIRVWRHAAYQIVKECAGESQTKDHPDRYFCAAVHKRLRERGYLEGAAIELL